MPLHDELDALNRQLVAAYDLHTASLPSGTQLDMLSAAIEVEAPGSRAARVRLMEALDGLHDLYGRAARNDVDALMQLRVKISAATGAINDIKLHVP